MKKTMMSGLLACLLLAAAVLAAPPASNPNFQSSPVGSLQVLYPETFNYVVGGVLNFHVFNSSSGPLNVSQVDCSIHVYNRTTGEHIFAGGLTKGYSLDHYWFINSSVVRDYGRFGYLVWCDQLDAPFESGFLAGSFYVTPSGEDDNRDYPLAVVLVLLPLLFGWLLVKWCISLGEDHSEVKIFLSLLGLMSVFVSLWFAMLGVVKYSDWLAMQDAIGFYVWVLALVFVVLWSYFIIYFLVMLFNAARKQKVERLRY